MKNTKQGEGSTTDKVYEILRDAGFNPDGITPATGYWKSADVYRWECILTVDGIRKPFGCWQTMTQFIKLAKKHGIKINKKEDEIWANELSENSK